MNLRDFTFEQYHRLLAAAVDGGYEILPVERYLAADRHPDRFLVLRHDVDRRADHARTMARVEAAHDVAATYYFRTSTFDPDLAREVADLGHEVGYHYEDLAATRGDVDEALDRFAANLDRFRAHADVRTVCPHGSPLSRHQNLDLWAGERSPAEFDLLGEAYLSIDTDPGDPDLPTYFSDTGRRWGVSVPGFGDVVTTEDLIALLESGELRSVYVLAHPSRWSRSGSEHLSRVAWDLSAEAGKRAVKPVHGAARGVNGTGIRVTRVAAGSVMISRAMLSLVSAGR